VAMMLRLDTLVGHARLMRHDTWADTGYGLDLAMYSCTCLRCKPQHLFLHFAYAGEADGKKKWNGVLKNQSFFSHYCFALAPPSRPSFVAQVIRF